MRQLLAASKLVIMLSMVSTPSHADSVASFPEDWQEWPAVAHHKIFSADTVLPEGTSLFMQESVYSYTWINDGQGSPMTIRVHPEKLEQYRSHGPYSDGITVIAVAESANIIWVTEHVAGYPVYGSYNFIGEDVSDSHPSLDPDFCHSCHYTYQDICVNGTCFSPDDE